jgi:hypothetical protein
MNFITFMNHAGQVVTLAFGMTIVGFLLTIVWKIHKGALDINRLISEPDGKASISRFQLFLFTFVIAGVYALLSIEAGSLVTIPESVLGLLGMSGGGFLLSKGISGSGSKPTEQVKRDGLGESSAKHSNNAGG